MEAVAAYPATNESRAKAKTLDVKAIKSDFPIFANQGAKPINFLDSAASSQRPRQVLDAMDHYYTTTHANVHRGVYALAEEATKEYEEARIKIGQFIKAPAPAREVIFTKNATESLNLVAQSLGRRLLKPGDKVVLTKMEHHANLVPWLMVAESVGIEITYIDHDENGYLILDDLDRQLSGAKVVSVTLCSNVLGTLNPVAEIAERAHAVGAIVIADGAQYVPHIDTNVTSLGVDYLAFTGHKMLGPTGIGVLWGRSKMLEELPPFLGGGDMISDVRLDGFDTSEIPYKFEAGTPPIAEAIGLGAAVDYLTNLNMGSIRAHEIDLTAYAMTNLANEFGSDITIHGPKNPEHRGGVLSFSFRDVHPHDISQVLDQFGVCVRAGHHCAKPLMRTLGVSSTARASLYLYNDESDVDALVNALHATSAFFG